MAAVHEPLVNPAHSTSDAHDSALPHGTGDGGALTREQEDELLDAQCWTPRQALTSGYFFVNVFISGCINFGINGGINYALMHKYDYAGLWETPRTPNPYTSVLAFDMFLTSFLIVFFTTILITGGIHNEIKKGTIRPVTDAALRDSVWRLFPTRFKSPWLRAFLSGLLYCSVYFGFTLLLLATICLAGGMGGEGNVCQARTSVYPWIKGAWALGLALCSWPNSFLGHLNKSNLPQDVYDLFLARQKLEHPEIFAPKHAHAHGAGDPFSAPVAVPHAPGTDEQPGAAGTAGVAGSYAAGSAASGGYGYAPSTSADAGHRVVINGAETGGTYAQLPRPDRFRRLKN